MRKHLPLLLTCILLLSACADTPPINKANKSFERAWNAYISLMDDKALEHFATAATFYEEALSQASPSRVAQYPSSRVKAGISFYYTGLYTECIDSMAESAPSGELPWEAEFYSAMAYARMGDQQNTVKHLARFTQNTQAAKALREPGRTTLDALENGDDLDLSADFLEEAVQQQFVSVIRVTNGRRTIMPHTERCDGTFWWRQNKKPCNDSRDK